MTRQEAMKTETRFFFLFFRLNNVDSYVKRKTTFLLISFITWNFPALLGFFPVSVMFVLITYNSFILVLFDKGESTKL